MIRLKMTLIISFLAIALNAQVTKLEPTDDTYVYGGVVTDHTAGRLKFAPFPVGGAVAMTSLRYNLTYRNAIIREYTAITAENAMKMGTIWRSRDNFYFDDVDYLVNFAEQNNIRLHGHCLIWFKQSETAMPRFILELHNQGWGNKEDWKQLMKEYISVVVGRYKGKIASWDVVNESVKDDGSERTDDIWREHIGFPEYIDWAFQCAHEADPDAILFYNDFGFEYASGKRNKIESMVKGMKERGIPIHGIGLQTHTSTDRKEGAFKSVIGEWAVKQGLYVHVSELDVSCNPSFNSNAAYTDELKKKQAAIFNEISAAMANIPQNQQYGITQWAVADAGSYLSGNPDWAFLLGSQYEPKTPAYDYFVKGFNGKYIPWNQVVLNP